MNNVTQLKKEKITGKTGSYFHNNIVIPRTEDKASIIDGSGDDVTVYLNGYAIIPIEEYYETKGEPIPDGVIEEIENMRKRLNEV